MGCSKTCVCFLRDGGPLWYGGHDLVIKSPLLTHHNSFLFLFILSHDKVVTAASAEENHILSVRGLACLPGCLDALMPVFVERNISNHKLLDRVVPRNQ